MTFGRERAGTKHSDSGRSRSSTLLTECPPPGSSAWTSKEQDLARAQSGVLRSLRPPSVFTRILNNLSLPSLLSPALSPSSRPPFPLPRRLSSRTLPRLKFVRYGKGEKVYCSLLHTATCYSLKFPPKLQLPHPPFLCPSLSGVQKARPQSFLNLPKVLAVWNFGT